MICIKCDNEKNWKVEKRLVEQLYRGKTMMVPSEVTVCKQCGWYTVDTTQAAGLLKNTSKLYRDIYGDKDGR